jgi:hypothetical protein
MPFPAPIRNRPRLAVTAATFAAAALLPAALAGPAGAAPSLRNGGLESSANARVPVCWEEGGYGSASFNFQRTHDAHTGRWAERVRITSLRTGDRKLIVAQDSGRCAPAAAPGRRYRLTGWYKGSAPTGFVVYLSTATGSWSYWTSGPSLRPRRRWTRATWTTPPVPGGAAFISFGLNLWRRGTLTVDDFSIAPGGSNPATAAGAGSPAPSGSGADPTGSGAATPSATTAPAPRAVSACGKQTDWTPPQLQQSADRYVYTPLSDAAAAACVVPTGEAVPANSQANAYMPTDAELQAFHSAKTDNGDTIDSERWYTRYVTGRPGLPHPTTDELIQWGAHKWGIPEDWLRAQYEQESGWKQSDQGDLRTEPSSWLSLFPSFSCPTVTQCFESLGITQVKWRPDGSDDAGTEPLRWKSVAFNIDFECSILRYFYDNPYGLRSSWGDSSYHPLDGWLSLGGWFEPYPYGNSNQLDYVAQVKRHLADRDWPASPAA